MIIEFYRADQYADLDEARKLGGTRRIAGVRGTNGLNDSKSATREQELVMEAIKKTADAMDGNHSVRIFSVEKGGAVLGELT